MQRMFAVAAAAGLLLAASAVPAAAQSTTGTIVINGSVSARCGTTPGNGSTFGETIGLGELANANGVLEAALSGSSAAAPAFSRSYSLTCTGSNFGVSIEAQTLGNTDVATAPAGYTRAAQFTGRVSLDLVSSAGGTSTLNLDDSSSVAGATSVSAGPSNFLANSTANLRASAYGFATPSGAIMVAGPYQGRIIITVSPT